MAVGQRLTFDICESFDIQANYMELFVLLAKSHKLRAESGMRPHS